MTFAIALSGAPRFQAAAGAVLSSLPRSFAVLPPGAPHTDAVVAIDGDGSWVDDARAAIEEKARGVFVWEPRAVEPDSLARLAAAAAASGVTIRLARQWAGDPTVIELAAQARPASRTTLVDSHASVPPGTELGALLTAQVDLVQVATSATVVLDMCDFGADSYLASGQLVRDGRSHPLVLSGVLTTAGSTRATVRELLFEGRRSVTVGDGMIARASTASIGNERGDVILPAIYETAHRASLRMLARDLEREIVDVSDLAAFTAAAAATAPVLGAVAA